ncbi:alpha/beta fold hydrolase [Streptomyces sp. NPDC088194]|uniref:alpha/beta hydrolase n=1 Tax=Streptomyces sp. NPDC088194 TaxID=3154931 RepID=UPI00344C5D43
MTDDVERVRVVAPDGIELDAAVHRPASDGSDAPDGSGRSGARGTVLLVHGISADLDEGGAFVRLAERLAGEGLTAVRFSFRGHGASGGSPQGVTIAGEMLDLEAVAAYAAREFGGPTAVVAASFGAVATGLSMPWLGPRLARLALWNPVLDLRRTFLAPELPWGLANFGPGPMKSLAETGELPLGGHFPLGRVLFAEMACHRPIESYAAGGPPALVVHGDRDSYVSYDIARQVAGTLPGWQFHALPGADHGFHTPAHESAAIEVTARWLTAGCAKDADRATDDTSPRG